jgi:hypothetical protein
MTITSSKKRAKVTGITINLVDPNGNSRTVTIDPRTTKALFWDDKTVKNLLAPYYANNNPEMTRDELIALFGTIGKKVAGSNQKIKVTNKVIEKLWDETDDTGNSLPMLAKSVFCLPAPGGEG